MDKEAVQRVLADKGYPEGHQEVTVIVKPDGVRLGIHGAIEVLLHRHGLATLHERRLQLSASMAFAIYQHHEGHGFFQELIQYVTSGDCKVYVLVGFDAAARVHELIGATDPRQAAPGTVRALFSSQYSGDRPSENFVHAPDNLVEAVREMQILFGGYPYPPKNDD